MTVLIIVAAVFAFLLLLLILPVAAAVKYDDEFYISVTYGGIRVFKSKNNTEKTPPAKTEQKKELPENKKSKTGKKPNFISRIFKEKGKIEGLKFCFGLIKIVFSRIIWVVKKIKFKDFFLDITVASDDAANTAIMYGSLCAAVYPTVNFIKQNTSFGIKNVNIRTDFDKLSPVIRASVSVKTRLIYAVVAAVSFIFGYLRLKKESEKNER